MESQQSFTLNLVWSTIPPHGTGGPPCHSLSPPWQHSLGGPLKTDRHPLKVSGSLTLWCLYPWPFLFHKCFCSLIQLAVSYSCLKNQVSSYFFKLRKILLIYLPQLPEKTSCIWQVLYSHNLCDFLSHKTMCSLWATSVSYVSLQWNSHGVLSHYFWKELWRD